MKESKTRKEIENELVDLTKCSPEHIHFILDEFFFVLQCAFSRGQRVKLANLGTFTTRKVNVGNGTYVSFSRSKPQNSSVRRLADELSEIPEIPEMEE